MEIPFSTAIVVQLRFDKGQSRSAGSVSTANPRFDEDRPPLLITRVPDAKLLCRGFMTNSLGTQVKEHLL